jgi:hypothetical protein
MWARGGHVEFGGDMKYIEVLNARIAEKFEAARGDFAVEPSPEERERRLAVYRKNADAYASKLIESALRQADSD